MKIYNADGILLGRLCSLVAKDLLLGEEVKILNCEKVMISGARTEVFANMKQKQDRRGYPLKSAKRPRTSELFVKKVVRGMLPWRTARGKEAYTRLKCYIGVPEEFSNQKTITFEKASYKKLPNLKYITVREVIKHLGGKQ
ncbi:50S ribosomal protein L13 [archaeon]|jgi:large subunit ribosomal protein L13|nr:50S ribosomal protein L13 [archaeon]MBT6868902.1 50S ribosomal protein L13 [archaeon]MBT7192877.1 50S ribosomal protein L13 [archaeon]MBT7380843.1 50S ribosomal protein L13 [archaeon]MBT7507598.1 50S ribosomal protein L13 [archaeon]